MENLVLIVHLATALAIIVLILMQQGKGAEMGASFGSGGSQTLFGASGSGNFFSRLTAVFATLFFATSFGLAVMAKQKTEISDDFDLPAMEQVAPRVESDLPQLQETPTADSNNNAADVPEIPAN